MGKNYNKFITKRGNILLDLTEVTVTEETLGLGVTAYGKDGRLVTGTRDLYSTHVVAEISTEAEMDMLLTTAEAGSIYKYIGPTTDNFDNGTLYLIKEDN